MTTLAQKGVLGLTILTTVGLVALLASKRLGYEPRRRDGLLLEMINNVSSELNRLDSGYDGITTQMDLAKNRLAQLVTLHRENLLVCAILREKRNKALRRMAGNESGRSRNDLQ